MSNEPLVSICIPAYNNADTLAETMRCVQNQTWKNIELIVVDDHSTDGTAEVAKANADHRTRVYENETNLGMSGNWNRCLSLCSGKYIKLLCADDLLDADLIRREVNLLEADPEVVMVSTDTRFIDPNGNEKQVYRRYFAKGKCDGRKAARFSVFTRDYLGAPLANTFRRSAYEALGGFDDSFFYIVDYDFFMKLATSGPIYILHEPLNYFRLRAESNTSQVLGGDRGDDYVREHEKLVRKYAAALGLNETQVRLSVAIRRLMNVLGGWYLRLAMGKI